MYRYSIFRLSIDEKRVSENCGSFHLGCEFHSGRRPASFAPLLEYDLAAR